VKTRVRGSRARERRAETRRATRERSVRGRYRRRGRREGAVREDGRVVGEILFDFQSSGGGETTRRQREGCAREIGEDGRAVRAVSVNG